jgi:RNA polymerase sigma factor (sigma-70 family)
MSGWSGGYGDSLDVTEIITESERWLAWKAAALTRDIDERQDLVQEGRIAMWRSLDKMDPEKFSRPDKPLQENAQLWAMTAAKMRMNDVARRGTWLGKPEHRGVLTMPRPSSLDDLLYRNGDGDDNPIAELLTAADLLDSALIAYHRGEIYQALSDLPTRQREYVVLRFWGGYTEPMIKEALDLHTQPRNLWDATKQAAKWRLRARLEHLVGVS